MPQRIHLSEKKSDLNSEFYTPNLWDLRFDGVRIYAKLEPEGEEVNVAACFGGDWGVANILTSGKSLGVFGCMRVVDAEDVVPTRITSEEQHVYNEVEFRVSVYYPRWRHDLASAVRNILKQKVAELVLSGKVGEYIDAKPAFRAILLPEVEELVQGTSAVRVMEVHETEDDTYMLRFSDSYSVHGIPKMEAKVQKYKRVEGNVMYDCICTMTARYVQTAGLEQFVVQPPRDYPNSDFTMKVLAVDPETETLNNTRYDKDSIETLTVQAAIYQQKKPKHTFQLEPGGEFVGTPHARTSVQQICNEVTGGRIQAQLRTQRAFKTCWMLVTAEKQEGSKRKEMVIEACDLARQVYPQK